MVTRECRIYKLSFEKILGNTRAFELHMWTMKAKLSYPPCANLKNLFDSRGPLGWISIDSLPLNSSSLPFVILGANANFWGCCLRTSTCCVLILAPLHTTYSQDFVSRDRCLLTSLIRLSEWIALIRVYISFTKPFHPLN